MQETSVTQNFNEIKQELLDPQVISKKHDAEGRSATAKSILEARLESRSVHNEIKTREEEREQISKKQKHTYREQFEKERAIEDRLNQTLVKLKILIGFGDKKAVQLQEELGTIKSENNQVFERLFEVERELDKLKQQGEKLPDAKKILGDYYEKVETLPLTNQEKRDALKPELLESLSTKEYVALWRRLNPYFMAHVTRQGFRDHNGMISHSSGMNEFHGGFVSVLEDQKMLRPPLALNGLQNRNEGSIKQFLNDWVLQAQNETDAKDRLDKLLHFHLASAPKYPDVTAVHFANQIVADSYYGGETGNEIFFLYPSDVIGSQYSFGFNGWERDFTKPQSEEKWNDVFVWPNTVDNPGIPLNAGFVFLPESVPVDPNTGSKYASEVEIIDGEEKRVMVENISLINSFSEWGQTLNDQHPIVVAFKNYRNGRYSTEQSLKGVFFEMAGKELQQLGFTSDASMALVSELFSQLHWRTDFNAEVFQSIARTSGANWKRAENTIPVKEYWENYFTKNPNLQPKHLIYYDGDPTTAIYAFQQKNDVGKADTSTTEGKLLGFDDNLVSDMSEDPRANRGYEDLVETAEKIIEEHYQKKPKSLFNEK